MATAEQMEECMDAIATLTARLDEIGDMAGRFQAAENKLKSMEADTAALKSEQQTENCERRTIDQKVFQDVGIFASNPEDCSFKVRDVLESHFQHFHTFLNFVDKESDDIEYAFLRLYASKHMKNDMKGVEWMDEQLYHILSRKTSGIALGSVKNVEAKVGFRGALAWHRILKSTKGKNKLRIHELAKKVTNPNRVTTSNELVPAFEAWEALVVEYGESQGAHLHDTIKQCAAKRLVPLELENDIKKFADWDTYEDLRKYILEQVNQRQEPFFEGASTKAAGVNNLNVVAKEDEKDKSELDNAMGLAAEFHGYCHTCGQRGHSKHHCPYTQANGPSALDKGKGNGEGKDYQSSKSSGKGWWGLGDWRAGGFNPKDFSFGKGQR